LEATTERAHPEPDPEITLDEASREMALREPDPMVRMEKLAEVKETRIKRLVRGRDHNRTAEHERILGDFDSLLSKVEEIDDPVVNKRVTANFDHFIERLTRHYPEWDSEGRLRTYYLLKKISNSLNLHNADTYLDMAYQTLMARGTEATEMSHLTLNGKVERMYRDPKGEGANHLAGTLLLMNRGDDEYARQMVIDAIHLWSSKRFKKLRQDFATVPSLGTEGEESIIDLLEKEMEKAKRMKDRPTAIRAKQLWKTVLLATPGPALGSKEN
jgi:hypothetical protein